MKSYFKRQAENEFGDQGVAYMEITDGWPSRQIEIYGDVWRWGDGIHKEFLADQPFVRLGLTDEYVIPGAEFEIAWKEAITRYSPS